ncbi:DUF4959 domain-containing protein [Halosquirtibacter laminarini]|uniref:DUF4959 domain-containing protein n=1 Tax=Halosquirtibacter laminarini TaxID=3374600 RepID=A0AC61NNY1_9BACT|nr:DUF4959 domain-containing protein [Prolixibacteraceae bacterium]
MKRFTIYILLITFLLVSCGEKFESKPLKVDGTPPSKITSVIEVINKHGGATIKYTLPALNDLQYVEAKYVSKGEVKSQKVSAFENEIEIKGLSLEDVGEQDVELYIVDKGENRSEPVTAKISPTTPHYINIFKSITSFEDFGGALFKWSNPDSIPVYIDFMIRDEEGVLSSKSLLSTSSPEGTYNVRGLDPVARDFAAVVMDRYKNISDTFKINLTPLEEMQFPNEELGYLELNNDVAWDAWEGDWSHLFDGNLQNVLHTRGGEGWPVSLTLDLGKERKISRFKIWQRQDQSHFAYTHGNPKSFVIYGTNQTPSQSGDWDEWTEIMDFTIKKSSGLPLGQENAEDMKVWSDGHDVPFKADVPKYRYIRLKFTETWDGATYVGMGDMAFYGSPEK